nr:ImmA/IrrE family metallo-endopeptidase [Bacillus safensis]
MATRVFVKVELLEWAYNRASNKEKLHKKFKNLDKWLEGKLRPTFKQLEEFSKSTATPLGYFFLQHPPIEQLPIPHYRTLEDSISDTASPDLIETLYTMQRRQDFMRDYYEKYIGDPLSFVGSYRGQSVVELVNKIRQLLDLEFDWARKNKNFHDAIRFLVNRCEENRIMIMINGVVGSNTHRRLNVEEFRGFVLVDDFAPLIFINGADAKSAQIFTLIHEIAHIIIGSSAIVEASPLNKVNDHLEKFCNQAAAEFLCPKDSFIRDWHTHYGDKHLYKTLGGVFKVSPLVIGRRALELSLITKAEFFEFYNKYIEELKMEQKISSSGGDFFNTTRVRLGDLFSRVVIYQTQSGDIQHTTAQRLTGLKSSSFQKYIRFLNERRM